MTTKSRLTRAELSAINAIAKERGHCVQYYFARDKRGYMVCVRARVIHPNAAERL